MKNGETPTILVVLGATGDLMSRKIAPSLFNLCETRKLPEYFRVIGFARRDLSDEAFRARLAEQFQGRIRPEKFLSLFSYHRGEFSDAEAYRVLGERLAAVDKEWDVCSNKLFYLAVPPGHYDEIFRQISSAGLARGCGGEEGWTRIIVEKPFGKDAETAERLEEMLGSLFRESQIYRVDHYLAKEMVQNILALRFSNNLFEHNWSNQTIESIEIRLWETIGVETRGAFYDGIGALRDVGQNHFLQMLALLTMEHPISLEPGSIRTKRAQALSRLPSLSEADIRRFSRRSQYRGYRQIAGVAPDSETETYFKISGLLGSPRWQDVLFSLEGGKRLSRVRKEAIINFRHIEPCLCPNAEHYKNRIVISLEPEERISIEFWSKHPGHLYRLEPRSVDFLSRGRKNSVQYVEEYEKLLVDAIAGDQTLFISTAEVKAMWRFIDPISRAWKKNSVPLELYEPGEFPAEEPGEKP